MKSPAKSNISDTPSQASRRWLTASVATVALLLVGGIFFLFDPARGGFYPTCQFHQLTGLNCPGCGGLRALHHLTHGEIVTAFCYNPLLFGLLPFLAFIAFRWLRHGRAAFAGPSPLFRPATVWALLAVTLVFTILRNLPWPAFAWMSP